jgi:lysophospholipase L1-like esterase
VSLAARRTVAFAVALVLLLFGAHGGATWPRVLLVLVVFVVVATVWVRGQYADSLDDDSWLLPWPWAIGFCVVGAALLVLGLVRSGAGTGLVGAVLLYFGIGALVMRWRERDEGRRAWGLVFLGSGVVLGLLGSVLLGHVQGILPVGLLGFGLLLLLPVGAALLSEEAIQWLKDPGRGAWRVGGVVGGVVVFGVVAVGTVVWVGSTWVLGVLLVLCLLVVALASSTQADIVAILAVIALMGVTPLQETRLEVLNPGGHSRVLVALGDSYMSGEGASVYYQGTDEGGGDTCRRSPTAWAAMAGQQRPFDGLAFVACSGARTANVRADPASIPSPRVQKGEPGTQLAQYQDLQKQMPFTPSLVVLSIGGNDAGFSTIGLMCLAPGDCNTKSSLWTGGLDQVERLLRGTYAEVRAAFPTTPVVVTAYPNPIDNQVSSCGQVALSIRERNFLQDFVQRLNARVQKAAADYGFYYLKAMEGSLAASHLQLCDPLNGGRPGLNFIGLRSVNGVAEQRFNPANWSHSSLHPNERGHAAMLRVFQTWLADTEPLSATGPKGSRPVTPPAPPAGEQAGVVVQPPCDLFDLSPTGCRPQGQAWALQQVGRLLLTKGWLAALTAAAAWAASVAFFGWRRRLAAS